MSKPLLSSAGIWANPCTMGILGAALCYACTAASQDFCSTLDDDTDKTVCSKIVTGRGWLTSVQKISAGSPVPENLLTSPNRLYIFDSRNSDHSQAVYHLPHYISLPANSAVIGNAPSNSVKPRLLLGQPGSSKGSPGMVIEHAGNYLLENLEIRSQISASDSPDEDTTFHQVLVSIGGDQLEVSGVILGADYSPDAIQPMNELVLLTLGSASAEPTSDIHDCVFELPDISPTSSQVSMIATMVGGNMDMGENTPSRKIKYANNCIIASDDNSKPGNIKTFAFVVSGEIDFQEGSACNSVETTDGNDLLPAHHDALFMTQLLTSTSNGAIGFTNGYGWGWTLEQGLPKVSYDSWGYWQKQGVPIQCDPSQLSNRNTGAGGKTSSNQNSGIGIGTTITVTVVVVTVVVVSSIIALFAGRKYLRKINWKKIEGWVKPATSTTILRYSKLSSDSETEIFPINR